MIRKISGKQSNTTIHHLENNDGTKITDIVDIANRLAQEISKNSSSNNYRAEFKKYQEKAEKEHLDFDTDISENYNVPFTIRELCDALKKSHDTATGPDEIHYQLLKHLPRDSLMVLLDIFNDNGLQVKFLNAGKRPLCYLFLNQAKTQKTRPIIAPYL